MARENWIDRPAARLLAVVGAAHWVVVAVAGHPGSPAAWGHGLAGTLLFMALAWWPVTRLAGRWGDAERNRVEQSLVGASVNLASEAIVWVDEEGRIQTANDAAVRMLGDGRAQLVRRPFWSLVPPEEAPLWRGQWMAARTALHSTFRTRLRDRSGAERPVRVRIQAARIEGRLRYCVLIADATAETRISRRLAATDHELSLLLRHVPVVTFALSGDGAFRTLYTSPNLQQITGYAAKELLADDDFWIGRVHPDDREEALEARSRALTAKGVTHEYRWRLADGRYRWFVEAVRLVPADDERDAHLVGIWLDITERRELQEEVQRALRAAEAAARDKAEFLAAMSHEIRTPMAGLLGVGRLLAETDLDPEQAEYVATIQSAGEILVELISNVLDLAKIDAGRMTLCPEVVETRAIVARAASIFSARAAEKAVRLVIECEESVPEWVVLDPARLGQVLMNLVGNAVKFTDTGEVRVRVKTAEEGGRAGRELQFEVIDTGVGLSSEQMERIFEPFVQASSHTSRRYGGTGLGLAISRDLVSLMGGTLRVESTPGVGSRFWFRIPLVCPDAEAIEKARAADELEADVLPTAADLGFEGTPRILLAEDNPVIRMVVCRTLGRLGFEVEAVETGVEAIAALDRARFDLVLMDWRMPVMDGLEAARRIRSRPGPEAKIPIVALTANASKEDRDACMRAGMDAYLAKPVQPEELMACVRRLLGEGAAATAPS